MKNLLLQKGITFGCALLFGGALTAQISTFPYSEDFESFTNCTGTCNSPCSLPVSGNPMNDWMNESTTDDAEWTTDNGGTSSSSTGPSVDYSDGTSAGKYLYIESSSPCFGTEALLYSPTFNLSGVGGMNLVFAYHMYGQTQGTLSIDASSDGGSTWTQNLWTMSGDQGDMWYTDTVSLTSFVGGNVIIRFRGDVGTDFYSDMAIDAISLYEPLPNDAGVIAIPTPGFPSCNLANSNVTATIKNFGYNDLTSVTANWAVNGLVQTPVTWTGSVAPNADTTISVGIYSFNDGDVLEVWTSNPNMTTELGVGPLNDTASIIIQSGLSGSYTIGATGDYATFTDAINALTMYGVCSAVTFDVQDGTYNEQVVIGEIMGASATNTITFQSLSGDNLLVEMTYAASGSTDNYVVQLDGADYISFKDITLSTGGTTYATALLVTNGAEYNVFEGNRFLGNPSAASTSANMAVISSPSGSLNHYNTFEDNVIRYGTYGMYWYGQNTSNFVTGLVLEGNAFVGNYYRCLQLYYSDSATVRDNDFGVSGLYGSLNYLMYAYYMNGNAEISNNRFTLYKYGYALYLGTSTASPVSRGRVMNNSIVIEDLTSNSTSYGIYFATVNNWDVLNNSFNIISQGTGTRCMYITGGGGNDLYNNNVSLDGPGYALYVGGGVNASDYNNLYAPIGIVGYFSGDYPTLNDWQANIGFDLNSVSGDPLYASTYDLHTCNDTLLDGAGNPAVFATLDMDGQTRDTLASDIGADEFLGLINFGFAEDSIWKCSNEAVTLGGFEPSSDATFAWSTSEATPTILAQNPGLYTVTATTVCGSAMSSIEIVNIPDAVADFTTSSSYVTGVFTSTSTGTIDTYSWDFGDGSTSTEENPLHVFTSPGYHFVTLTVTGPCGTSTYTDSILLELVDIDENQLNNSLTIYPNPNGGQFTMTVSLEGASNVSATLVDARGMVIWNTEMKNINGNASEEVDVDVAPGIYFMKVSVDDITTLRKVLVE